MGSQPQVVNRGNGVPSCNVRGGKIRTGKLIVAAEIRAEPQIVNGGKPPVAAYIPKHHNIRRIDRIVPVHERDSAAGPDIYNG